MMSVCSFFLFLVHFKFLGGMRVIFTFLTSLGI
uniref:Uncharacterized protein n=1 Tax=Anguilla anguilla TaxID=7936 RepID=A0A0E9SY17_ANGAN